MKILNKLIQHHTHPFFQLNVLHILNDGYFASFALFLPFIAKDFQISLTDVGLLGTILNSLGFFLALPSGYIAAKIGGLRLLIFALFFYTAGYLLTGLSPTFWSLFPAAIIMGIGLGVFHPVAFALIAKWSTKETRGRMMGNFTALGEVGRIGIASVLTIIIAAIGWRSTAFMYAGVGALIGLFFFFFVFKKVEKITLKEKPATPMRLRDIIAHKRFLFVNMTSLLDSFASTSLFIFIPFLLLQRGADPALLGFLSAAYFAGNFVGKATLGRLVDTFGNTKVFICSEFLMAICIALMASTPFLPIIIVSSIILGIFTKGTVPVVQTMVSESVEHHGNFEKAFGFNSMVARIGGTIAPVLLGFMSDQFGITIAFFVMAAAALLAIIPAIGFALTKS